MGFLDWLTGGSWDGGSEEFIGGGEEWTDDFVVRSPDGRNIGQGNNPKEINQAIRAAKGAGKTVGWVERNPGLKKGRL